jgi:hypothetical protein
MGHVLLSSRFLYKETTNREIFDMFRFKCPGCQAVLQATEALSGKQVKCSQCGKPLVVPQPPAAPAPQKKPAFILCICGQCKNLVHASADAAGRQFACTTCNHPIDIPAEDGILSPGNTMKFTCSACGQSYCVLAKYAGKKFKCQTCQQALMIPAPKPAARPQPKQELPDVPPLEEEPMELVEEEPEAQPEPPAAPQISRRDLDRIRAKRSAVSSPKSSRPARGGGGSSRLRRFLVPLILCAVWIIIGFPIMFAVSGPGEDRSAEAAEYAKKIISLVNKGDVEELEYEFYDLSYLYDLSQEQGQEDTPEPQQDQNQPVNKLIAALKKGEISDIESTVDYTNIDSGSAGYVIRNRIKFQAQPDLQAHLLVVDDLDLYTLFMIVSDPQGTVQAAIGTEEPTELASLADAFVEENSVPMKMACSIGILLGVLYILMSGSMMIVFKGYGYPAWAAFVPIYGPYVARQVASQKGGVFGFGLWLLPFLFFPILAFTEDFE